MTRLLAVAIGMGVASSAIAPAEPSASPTMVFFDWGKPDIRGDDQAVLDQLAADWRANPQAHIQVSGFTDRSGSAAYNRRASRKRAEMVRDELIKRGVSPSAISVHAYGEERPLVLTEDGVREVQNRRVEILIEGGGTSIAADSSGPMLAPFPIVGPNGEPRGTASFFSDGTRTTINVEAEGLPAGVHGIHLHAAGRCEGPDFKSAGTHWNPAGRQHGRDNPAGPHLGDLPNLTVAADGKGSATFAIEGDMADADGTSLVIHVDPDDNKTDPSGNSGARIACAVLTTPG